MKILKIAVQPLILLALLVLSGCATSTISAFQQVSPSENNKVAISSLVVTEKNMETKKTPDAAEKAVADAVSASLKENLNRKGLLTDGESASFYLDLHMYYHFHDFFEWLSAGEPAKILTVRATLKGRNGSAVAQIDSKDGTGALSDYRNITTSVAVEIADQIEKIFKEGVTVGKSP